MQLVSDERILNKTRHRRRQICNQCFDCCSINKQLIYRDIAVWLDLLNCYIKRQTQSNICNPINILFIYLNLALVIYQMRMITSNATPSVRVDCLGTMHHMLMYTGIVAITNTLADYNRLTKSEDAGWYSWQNGTMFHTNSTQTKMLKHYDRSFRSDSVNITADDTRQPLHLFIGYCLCLLFVSKKIILRCQ